MCPPAMGLSHFEPRIFEHYEFRDIWNSSFHIPIVQTLLAAYHRSISITMSPIAKPRLHRESIRGHAMAAATSTTPCCCRWRKRCTQDFYISLLRSFVRCGAYQCYRVCCRIAVVILSIVNLVESSRGVRTGEGLPPGPSNILRT